MSEFVERIARAHWEARRLGFSIPRMGMHEIMEWSILPDDFRQREIGAARAAIAAMREPTEAMLEASNREWDGRMSHRSSGAWQAMIDEALK